jgi:hypothetical protein
MSGFQKMTTVRWYRRRSEVHQLARPSILGETAGQIGRTCKILMAALSFFVCASLSVLIRIQQLQKGATSVSETVPQYMQRILGYAEGQQPLKIQAASAKKLERLLKGVPAAKLRKRPAADKWSVAEIMAHLADSEIVTGFRLRQILGTPGAPIPAYDQDAWAKACRYEKRDARKALEQFRVLREANLELLKTLTSEQWQHHGMHSERGAETIERLVKLIAGHDLNHTQQIERIVVPAKKRGK